MTRQNVSIPSIRCNKFSSLPKFGLFFPRLTLQLFVYTKIDIFVQFSSDLTLSRVRVYRNSRGFWVFVQWGKHISYSEEFSRVSSRVHNRKIQHPLFVEKLFTLLIPNVTREFVMDWFSRHFPRMCSLKLSFDIIKFPNKVSNLIWKF